jgi:hypothetical protein
VLIERAAQGALGYRGADILQDRDSELYARRRELTHQFFPFGCAVAVAAWL